jgi:hypothetical protein
MRTNQLWQALETLGGAAPQRDWAQALGDQWAIAGALLRQTGDIAEELICPKSSEIGCFRQIVKSPGGGIRAECGDLPQRCANLPLRHDQVKILALDVSKLFRAIFRAFDLQDVPTSATLGSAVNRLGRYEIRAGVGFPMFLGLPDRGEPLMFRELSEVAATPGPKALLVPYRSAVGPELAAHLEAAEVWIFNLDDVVIWDAKHTLGPRYDPGEIFKTIITTLPGTSANAPQPPALGLPAGTHWSSISMDFENAELLMLRGPGVQRAVTPSDVGMADRRSGKARQPWVWLSTFAMHGGRMPTGRSSAQKHKQFVSERLVAFTGISEDPIEDEDGHYVAKFSLSADGLSQGAAGKSRRTFAEGD